MSKFEFIQNPDSELFAEISEAIRANNNYCCCATEKTSDTMCMCKAFREQEESGFCHCGRFYKIRKFETVALVYSLITHHEEENSLWYWKQLLARAGFITTEICLSTSGATKSELVELSKTKVEKSNIVVLLDELIDEYNHEDYLSIIKNWANELGKPVVAATDFLILERNIDEDR